MITLLINNQTVTTRPDESIVLSKSSSKVGKLQTRQGSLTNDFAIPATAENVSALGYSSLLEIVAQEVTHSKKIDAVLIANGQAISRGYVQIVEANYLDRTITISFFGGNSDWVAKMSGKSIRDVDLSGFNHEWTLDTIRNSWTNTEGYIYPLINYGDLDGFDFGQNAFYTEDFYPALYQKTLLAYAFSEIGYKIDGSFINEFPYQRAIIPFSEKSFFSSPEFADTFVGSMTGQQLYQQTFTTVPQDITENLIFTTAVQNDYNSFSTFSNQFKAEKNETFKMRLVVSITNFQITNTGGLGTDVSSLAIQAVDTVGNVAMQPQTILELTGTGTDTISGTYVFEFDWVAAKDTFLNAQFTFTTDSTTATSVQYVAQYDTYTLSCDGIDRTMREGDTVELAYVMPDIQVLDIVRDMVQRHGLIVSTNDYTQTVSFDRFELMPKKDAADWSDKVSVSGVHRLNFTEANSSYARVNLWKYKSSSEDDESLYEYDTENSQPLGQGQIEIQNEFLKDEKTLYQSVFKATVMTDPFGNNAGLYVPEIVRYGYGQAEEFSPGARILYVLPNALISDLTLSIISIANISGTFVSNIAYAYFYKFGSGSDYDYMTDMLSYGSIDQPNVIGETLISSNYRELSNILNNGKSVEVSVQLREHEFASIDFSAPVYINSGFINGYFFINEIENYQGGNKLCNVKLIEI